MADVSAATVLVTGGTSGIGRETVRRLAEDGATVLVHGRDGARGEAVCEWVRAETPGDAQFLRADLADFDDVRSLAANVRAVLDEGADYDGLDVLVNNAGTWQPERRLVDATGERTDGTRAGVEFTVAVNHCAHVLLTAELWPLLRSATDAGSGEKGVPPAGRVVTVASGVHGQATFDIDALTDETGPSGQAAYAHSKLANVLFASELAHRAQGTGVTSNSCHPGVVPSTALARDSGGLSRSIWKAFGVVGGLLPFGPVDTERDAAETQYYLATAPEVADVTGEYFVDCEPKRPSTAARSRENQQRLWEWTADVVGVSPTFPSD